MSNMEIYKICEICEIYINIHKICKDMQKYGLRAQSRDPYVFFRNQLGGKIRSQWILKLL